MIKKISYLLFAVLLVLVLSAFLNYGVTWDEEFHRIYGELIASWFQTFFYDRSAVDDPFFIYYGGLFDLATWAAGRISPLGFFETRHLLGGLLGLWTLFMSWKIARRISGEVAALLTFIILAAHPAFYGHMFANPVDIPFAAFFVTSIYCLIIFYENLPQPPLNVIIQLGVAMGLALSIRVTGMVVLAGVFLFCLGLWKIQAIWKVLSCLKQKKQIKMNVWPVDWNFLWLPVIVWPLMIVCWPYAHLNPLINPFGSIWRARAWDWEGMVFFGGFWYPSTALPKIYLFQSILNSLPEFFIAALVIGATCLIISLMRIKKWNDKQINQYAKLSLVTFPIVIAFTVNAFIQKTQMDGFRHYLFVIPLLAVIGGVSLDVFLKSGVWKSVKILTSLVLFVSLGITVFDMVRLHPYQTVYFNRVIAGGLKHASLHYETDYWGSSYREGIEWVIENYHPDLGRKIRVANSSAMFQIGYYLEKDPQARERFEVVLQDPDIYLSTTRWNFHKRYPGKILHTVERQGVALLYVIEVEKT